VVVVGAGAGGLTVAIRLAFAGHDVTVYEAGHEVGGSMRGYERDGFVFDTEATALHLPAVYRDLFLTTSRRRAGAALEEAVDLSALTPALRYRWPNGIGVDVPTANHRRVAQAFGDVLAGTAARDWTALSERASQMWSLVRPSVLDQQFPGATTLSRRWGAAGLRTVAPYSSLRRLGTRYLADARLRSVLDVVATDQGNDPRHAAAAMAMLSYAIQTFGTWHVGGGMRELARAMQQRAEDLGARVELGHEVVAVRTDGDRVRGVELADGTSIEADVVVSDVDVWLLHQRLLIDRRTDAYRKLLSRSTPSAGRFQLFLALRTPPPGTTPLTVVFPDRPDGELEAVFGGRPSPAEEPTLSISAPKDRRMSPTEPGSAWTVSVLAPLHDPGNGFDWDVPDVASRYATRLLDRLEAAGFDLQGRLLWHEYRSPADTERATRARGGAVGGIADSGPRSRPIQRRTANCSPVPGLFVVGRGARPGPWLPVVGMGATVTAAAVLERFPVE
jgi:phytoene desaturase